VAFLAGNKQLARQIERQTRDLGFPVVRFQGTKDSWNPKDVRAYNFGRAIGVMNYWNYFNANPGVDPADMLILDDVRLLKGALRELLTVYVKAGSRLCRRILTCNVARCPTTASRTCFPRTLGAGRHRPHLGDRGLRGRPNLRDIQARPEDVTYPVFIRESASPRRMRSWLDGRATAHRESGCRVYPDNLDTGRRAEGDLRPWCGQRLRDTPKPGQ